MQGALRHPNEKQNIQWNIWIFCYVMPFRCLFETVDVILTSFPFLGNFPLSYRVSFSFVYFQPAWLCQATYSLSAIQAALADTRCLLRCNMLLLQRGSSEVMTNIMGETVTRLGLYYALRGPAGQLRLPLGEMS